MLGPCTCPSYIGSDHPNNSKLCLMEKIKRHDQCPMSELCLIIVQITENMPIDLSEG